MAYPPSPAATSITAILAAHSAGNIARSTAKRRIAVQLRQQGVSAGAIRWLLALPRLLSVQPPYNRWRARYLSQAGSRLTQSGLTTAALTTEARWYRQHLQMNRARKVNANNIRSLVQEFGPILGWKAEIDSSTTPECRYRHGKNFQVRNPPQGQLPGAGTHAGCRCEARRPYPNAEVL